MVEIMTNYVRPERRKEVGGGPRIVEASGYIPTKIQVENMMIAGQRLNDYRREQYDYSEGDSVPDDVVPDPTRNPEFDLADATRLGREAKARIDKAKKEAEAEFGEKVGNKAEGKTSEDVSSDSE